MKISDMAIDKWKAEAPLFLQKCVLFHWFFASIVKIQPVYSEGLGINRKAAGLKPPYKNEIGFPKSRNIFTESLKGCFICSWYCLSCWLLRGKAHSMSSTHPPLVHRWEQYPARTHQACKSFKKKKPKKKQNEVVVMGNNDTSANRQDTHFKRIPPQQNKCKKSVQCLGGGVGGRKSQTLFSLKTTLDMPSAGAAGEAELAVVPGESTSSVADEKAAVFTRPPGRSPGT